MDKQPKRRKRQDNPYKILKNNNTYKIIFKDNQDITHEVLVTKELYDVFDEFELKDKSMMNEEERHLERFVLSDEVIYERAINKQMTLDDDLIYKSSFEELKKAIELLPDIQRRRIKMFYFGEKTEVEIALIERTTQQAISKTLQKGIKNLKKILKKYI